jgi:hypothetical protein
MAGVRIKCVQRKGVMFAAWKMFALNEARQLLKTA